MLYACAFFGVLMQTHALAAASFSTDLRTALAHVQHPQVHTSLHTCTHTPTYKSAWMYTNIHEQVRCTYSRKIMYDCMPLLKGACF